MMRLNDIRHRLNVSTDLAEQVNSYLASGHHITEIPFGLSVNSKQNFATRNPATCDVLAHRIKSLRSVGMTWAHIALDTGRDAIDCKRIHAAYLKRLNDAAE